MLYGTLTILGAVLIVGTVVYLAVFVHAASTFYLVLHLRVPGGVVAV